MKQENLDLIKQWQDAYEKANDKPAPDMCYERGWFVISKPYVTRYRRKKVESMISVLLRRIDYGDDQE